MKQLLLIITIFFTFNQSALAQEAFIPTTPLLPEVVVIDTSYLPNGCEQMFSKNKTRSFIRETYQKNTITKKSRNRIDHMIHCLDGNKRSIDKYREQQQVWRKNYLCTQTKIQGCIRAAAKQYNVSYDMLKRKAWCESRFNPYATNGAHTGLFQFRTDPPSTWSTTPYRGKSPWRAKYNALAAAWMHSVGRGGEWECR